MPKRDFKSALGQPRQQPPGWEDIVTPPPVQPEPEAELTATSPQKAEAPDEIFTVACRLTGRERDRLLTLADDRRVPYTYLLRWIVLEGIEAISGGKWTVPDQLEPARRHKKARKGVAH